MSKEQNFFNLYEKLHGSEWAKRYKKWLTDTLVFDKDEIERKFEESFEEFRESFIAAEVDRLVGLVVETGDVGEHVAKCLDKWNIEEMARTYGIIWLLESIIQDRDRKEEGRLVLRWEQ